MRVLYFGNNPRGVVCLEAIIDAGHDVVAAICHAKDHAQDSASADVATIATTHGVPVFRPDRVNAPDFISDMKQLQADVGVMAGYNRILGAEMLTVARHGILNLHGGRLPQYRGAAPLNWQIINGESEMGLSILYVDEGIDTGDIAKETLFHVDSRMTIRDVLDQSLSLFPEMIVEVLTSLEAGALKRTPQPTTGASYWCRRYPKDGEIKFRHMSADQVRNLVRALVDPYPGAFFRINGIVFKVERATVHSPPIRGPPGRIVKVDNQGPIILAKDRGVHLALQKAPNGQHPLELLRPGADVDD